MMSFNDFARKNNWKNKATSNIKIQQVLCSFGLNNVGVYLHLHPSKGTHAVCYFNGKYFVSFGVVCPKKLSKFILKLNGHCLYSEYQIQKNDSFCASYCFYIICLTKVIGIDFKSAVLNLYYQRFF